MSLAWFNVKDYGATGNGSTDDTSAINSAIAALVAASGGVLYFPAATYKVSSTLSAISVQCTILGDGAGSGTLSRVATNQSADTFSVSANGVQFLDLSIYSSIAQTGGACINTTGGGSAKFVNCELAGYDGLLIENSNIWTMTGCYVSTTHQGVRVRNTGLPDTGDWSVVQTNFAPAAGVAVHIDSSGGGRIIGCKINGNGSGSANAIEMAWANSTNSSVLLIEGCSIENMGGNGIDLATSSTGTYRSIVINACEFLVTATGKPIYIHAGSAGQIYLVTIDEIVAAAGAANGGAVVNLTNLDSVRIDAVEAYQITSLLSTTTCTNVKDKTV